MCKRISSSLEHFRDTLVQVEPPHYSTNCFKYGICKFAINQKCPYNDAFVVKGITILLFFVEFVLNC